MVRRRSILTVGGKSRNIAYAVDGCGKLVDCDWNDYCDPSATGNRRRLGRYHARHTRRLLRLAHVNPAWASQDQTVRPLANRIWWWLDREEFWRAMQLDALRCMEITLAAAAQDLKTGASEARADLRQAHEKAAAEFN